MIINFVPLFEILKWYNTYFNHKLNIITMFDNGLKLLTILHGFSGCGFNARLNEHNIELLTVPGTGLIF